jgi:hypothetical protein
MAGKFATIVNLGLGLEYANRPIVQALKSDRTPNINVRVQPAGEDFGYLIVEHKKSKDLAEKAMMNILDVYRGLGGREFDSTALPEDAPKPEMMYLTNDQVKEPPTPEEIWGPRTREY